MLRSKTDAARQDGRCAPIRTLRSNPRRLRSNPTPALPGRRRFGVLLVDEIDREQILLTLLFTLIGAGRRFFGSASWPSAYRPAARPAQSQHGGVYPQFRKHSLASFAGFRIKCRSKSSIAPGLSLDSIIDPELGARVYERRQPAIAGPDLVADVISNPDKLKSLEVAEGYQPAHFQAGASRHFFWHAFEKEGFIFFPNRQRSSRRRHLCFLDKTLRQQMGLALLRMTFEATQPNAAFRTPQFWRANKTQFRPVVTLLRTPIPTATQCHH